MIRMLMLAIPLVLSPAALAVDDDESSRSYAETRFGQITPDFDNLEPAWSIGQSAGYPIPGLPWAAVELDMQLTLFGGENSGGAGALGSGNSGGSQGDGTCPDPGNTTDPDCPLYSGGDNSGNSGGSGNVTRSDQPFRMFGYGLYASVTTPGKFLARAKYGVSGVNTSIREIQELAGGPSWKAGLGYRASRESLISLEYTRYNRLVDGLHLGLSYDFGRD